MAPASRTRRRHGLRLAGRNRLEGFRDRCLAWTLPFLRDRSPDDVFGSLGERPAREGGLVSSGSVQHDLQLEGIPTVAHILRRRLLEDFVVHGDFKIAANRKLSDDAGSWPSPKIGQGEGDPQTVGFIVDAHFRVGAEQRHVFRIRLHPFERLLKLLGVCLLRLLHRRDVGKRTAHPEQKEQCRRCESRHIRPFNVAAGSRRWLSRCCRQQPRSRTKIRYIIRTQGFQSFSRTS